MTRAVKWGKLAINPAKNAESPKQRKYTASPLTLKQAEALLKAVEGDRYEAIFTCAALGLRRGEVLGLTWTNIVLNDSCSAGVLNVARTLSRIKGKGLVLCDVKTQKSRRTIRLPRFAIEALLRRQMIQEQERINAGEEWKETDLVFTGGTGGPLMPEKINELHRDALERAKLHHVRFHDLRHTAATLLLSKKVPMKMVSEILGHSTFQFTMETYGHVVENMRDETTEAFDQMFGEKRAVVAQVVALDKLEKVQ
jgi:integrase